jgi:two-component system NarL family response regulator
VKELFAKQRILLVDDHQIFRESLRSLLDKFSNIEVVGEASDGLTAIRLAQLLSPDIVCMDIGMAGLNGIETTRQIITLNPTIKVVALSTYSDPVYVTDIMNAGATAFVCKSEGIEELRHAILAVQQGKIYLCTTVAKAIANAMFVNRSESNKPVSLSNREQQILRRIADGKSSVQIAGEFNIATGTVDVHRRNIMRKLELHNAVELTRYAIKMGLVSG